MLFRLVREGRLGWSRLEDDGYHKVSMNVGAWKGEEDGMRIGVL